MPHSRPQPNCYIIAGSNGAGKTTFATRFLPKYAECANFINPDLIARGLSPFNPDAALARAATAFTCSIYGFPVHNWPCCAFASASGEADTTCPLQTSAAGSPGPSAI